MMPPGSTKQVVLSFSMSWLALIQKAQVSDTYPTCAVDDALTGAASGAAFPGVEDAGVHKDKREVDQTQAVDLISAGQGREWYPLRRYVEERGFD